MPGAQQLPQPASSLIAHLNIKGGKEARPAVATWGPFADASPWQSSSAVRYDKLPPQQSHCRQAFAQAGSLP